MIRLPKKIVETIYSVLGQDYYVEKRVFIDSHYRDVKLHLIVLSLSDRRLFLLKYYGDNSYSFLSGFTNIGEVMHELRCQVAKYI